MAVCLDCAPVITLDTFLIQLEINTAAITLTLQLGQSELGHITFYGILVTVRPFTPSPAVVFA